MPGIGFGDLIRRAQAGNPQLVTKNGRDAVVVLSVEDYARLAGSESLVEFLGDSAAGGGVPSGWIGGRSAA